MKRETTDRSAPMHRRAALLAALGLPAAALLAAGPGQSFAQSGAWPARPIKLIAPSAPGGATDTVGRMLSRHLEKSLGQSIVVEAKPGAGTIIGVESVKNAAPDGYTLLISGSSTHSANPYLYAKLPYDPGKDFQDVGMVGFIPAIGLVRASLGVRTTAELIAYAKKNPGRLNYGYATSSSQVPPALLMARAQIETVGVAYKSLSQIITDLAAGTIDYAFLDIMSAAPALQNKAIVPFATTSQQRATTLPDVAPVADVLPGYEVRSWIGIATPAGTPDGVIDKLNIALGAALKDASTRQALERLGMTVQAFSRSEMASFAKADRQRWAEWVRLAKIEPIQ